MPQFSRTPYSGDAWPGRRYRALVARHSDRGAFPERGIFGVETVQTDLDFEPPAAGAACASYAAQAAAGTDAEICELERMYSLEDPRT
jgi:hypothetical protein